MKFSIRLTPIAAENIIPINYQYPLSSALYRIIAKGDAKNAEFLHGTGYGKGFKFFTFSQINCPFKIEKISLNYKYSLSYITLKLLR
jgi:CRISPR-associated endoribonuclease Cas6